MKTYTVNLTFTQISEGTVKIKANSLEEAEEKADEIQSEDVEWNPVNGEMSVDSVS